MHLGLALLQNVLIALFLVRFSRSNIFLASMADADTTGESDNKNNSNDEERKELPSLPTLANYAANEVQNIDVLTVDGDALSLDRLGPMIINTDGTVRRIANWDILSHKKRNLAGV